MTGDELIGLELSPISFAIAIGLGSQAWRGGFAIRVVNIGAPRSAAELSLLSRRLRMLIDERDADLVICDVGGLTNVDAATVEGLARLQLTAHRMGCDVRLVNASEDLQGLLALTGLCEIVGLCERT
jgi:ABC-type transporter Mla MlaB component